MNLWLFSNVSVVVILRRFNLLGNHKKQDYYFVFVEVFVKPDSKRAERVFRCVYDDIFFADDVSAHPFSVLSGNFFFRKHVDRKGRPDRFAKAGFAG